MDNLPRLHISVKDEHLAEDVATEAFIKAFDKTKHEIILTISYFQDNIYTKTKPHYVSHASGDLDNNLKLTIDGIFTELPTIDDALVTRITAEKIYSLSERIEILVETRPLCNSKHLEETVE